MPKSVFPASHVTGLRLHPGVLRDTVTLSPASARSGPATNSMAGGRHSLQDVSEGLLGLELGDVAPTRHSTPQ